VKSASMNYTFPFLSGGGKMGELTRAKDWSKTPVGAVEEWPQSLRTTISIILNSKFPMFLWWGPELICFYNDAYRPSLGKKGKHPSILGMRAAEAWAEIWPTIKPLIDQVLSGGGATWSEDQLIPILRNGRLDDVYWTFSYSPVNDETGKITGVLVTCTETTEKVNIVKKLAENIEEQKRFEQQLEKQVEERTKELAENNIYLEKMNKELQAFAYISSHDLQEPLRKIQAFASRIIEKEYDNLSDKGKAYFQRIQNSASRMQSLIDDLLVYSSTHTSDRKFENTSLNKIVNEVKQDLKEEILQKHANIDAAHLCSLKVIPFQFHQLFYNLISNSLKFSLPGQPPHIKISSEMAAGKKFKNDKLADEMHYCHIRIADNGIGFDQQYSEKIFELFQRLHGKMEYNGTGVGLAIVKKIVENHNGIVTATAAENKGATFDIYIPAPE
jgi:signal transduction histidine kinase